jgi:RNA polymerase sigma-70 factor (ECF subfamily)
MVFRSLLERARQGDCDARNTLLGPLRPRLRAIIRRQGCSDVDASDFAHQALLKIIDVFPQFRGDTSGELRAWCRMIAVRLWYDHFRKPPLAPLHGDVIDPCADGPDARLLGEEEADLVARTLERLKPHHRKVLELRFLEGLKCAEVARELGRTEEWVRIISMRACEEFRRVSGRQS